MLMVPFSLLCPWIQVSFLIYSPLSEMQNNTTFARERYVLSKKKIITASKGTLSVGDVKIFIFLNPRQQTSTAPEHLCSQGHLWLEAQSCKYVELHLFITMRSWAWPWAMLSSSLLKCLCAVDAKGWTCTLLFVCKYRDPWHYLRPQWKFTIGMLFVACACFISSSL